MSAAAISSVRTIDYAYMAAMRADGKAAIFCDFQPDNGKIRTDAVDILSVTNRVLETTESPGRVPHTDLGSEATVIYSRGIHGFFHAAWVLFLLSMINVGLGLVLDDLRLVASSAVVLSIASASLLVCISRAKKEHELSRSQ